MPVERVAKLVGELSMRWVAAGHHAPTVLGASHADVGGKPLFMQ